MEQQTSVELEQPTDPFEVIPEPPLFNRSDLWVYIVLMLLMFSWVHG